MNNKNENKNLKLILGIIITVILFIIGITRQNIEGILGAQNNEINEIVSSEEQQTASQDIIQGNKEQTSFNKVTIETGNSVIKKIENLSDSKIYFFDVGQADSILIVNNGKTMLIDAGNNEDGDMRESIAGSIR